MINACAGCSGALDGRRSTSEALVQLLKQPGGHVLVAQAPVWDASSLTLDGRDHLLIGLMPGTVKAHAERGLSSYLGQLYGVVSPGLIFSQHLFRGLRRAMLVGADSDADRKKLAAQLGSNIAMRA